MKIFPPAFQWFVFPSLIFSLLLSCAAHAQKPIPSGKEAKTQKDFEKRWLKYKLGQVELYKKHTKDPAKVHADAMEFIRKMIIDKENLLEDSIRKPLRELADKIRSNGSTDPLVLYHFAILRLKELNIKKSISEFKEAIKRFRNSTYPAEIKFQAIETLRYRLLAENADVEFKPYFKEYADLGLKMLSETSNQPKNRRYCWARVRSFMIDQDFKNKWSPIIKQQKTFHESVQKQEKVDPWIREMIAGFYQRNQAWQYRGGGFANEVKKDAWPLFQKHLKIAAGHLKKAWQIDPTIPHSSSKMISIAMAGGSDESTRTWFDRAVAAQMDFKAAYEALRWSIRPRWGGSHSAMYQFGVECASTRRYDTKVPWFFLLALIDIDQELLENGITFQKAGIYVRIKFLLEKYADQSNWAGTSNNGISKTWVMSLHVGYAILASEFKDARKLLDQLGDKFEPNAHAQLSGTPRDVAMVYALTGKGGEEVANIRKLLEKESQDEASKKNILQLLDVAIKKTKNPKAKPYFDYWSQQLKDQIAFIKGEWVPLKFDANLTHWEITKGNWKVENENSVVASNLLRGEGFLMSYLGKFPVPYEIRCDIELIKMTSPPPHPRFQAGVSLGDVQCAHPAQSGLLFWVEPIKGKVGISTPCHNPFNRKVKLKKVNHLHLIIKHKGSDIFVNGLHFPLSNMAPQETVKGFVPGQIGLGTATWLTDSGIARFSNLRIKKFPWDKEPAWKDNDARIKYLSYILKDEPAPSHLYYNRALSYDNKHDYEKALLDFKKALKVSPKNSNMLGVTANCYFALGQYKEAHSHFERSLKGKPSYLFVSQRAALFFAACPEDKYRDGKRALKLAENVIKKIKSPKWYHLRTLASAHAELGQFNEAIKFMQQSVAAVPEEDKKDKEKAERILKLFQNKKPYRKELAKKTK